MSPNPFYLLFQPIWITHVLFRSRSILFITYLIIHQVVKWRKYELDQFIVPGARHHICGIFIHPEVLITPCHPSFNFFNFVCFQMINVFMVMFVLKVVMKWVEGQDLCLLPGLVRHYLLWRRPKSAQTKHLSRIFAMYVWLVASFVI